MYKKVSTVVLKTIIVSLILSISLSSNVWAVNLFPDVNNKNPKLNPPAAVVWAACILLGYKYQVPPEIIYAVGYHESYNGFNQFAENNRPLLSCDKIGVGIMQVTFAGYKGEARVKLNNDWFYNLEEGVKILKNKWKWKDTIDKNGSPLLPRPSDDNPMILENWYFALWAFNGFCNKNNPLFYGKNVYQYKVITTAKDKLGININFLPNTEINKVIYTKKSNNSDAYKGYYVFATKGVTFSSEIKTYSCLSLEYILISASDFLKKFFPDLNIFKNMKVT